MARSTISASMTSFLPVGFMVGRLPSVAGSHSTSSTSTPHTLPFFPMNRVEARDHRRVQPSSWLLVVSVRRPLRPGSIRVVFYGRLGHDFNLGYADGSLSDAGASCDVRTRYSPPPMTSTRLPRALTSWSFGKVSPSRIWFCCASMSRAK